MNAEEKKSDFYFHHGIRFAVKNIPFWEGAKRGELLIHQCKDCGNKMFPPRWYCTNCMSENIDWIKVSGKGKVHTFSIAYEYPPTRVAKFLATPYVPVLIDLEEGVRMVSVIVGCKPEDVKIDMDVEVEFEDIGEDVLLPRFKPSASSS